MFVGNMRVVPDDSDVEETAEHLTDENFESFKDTIIYNEADVKAFAQKRKNVFKFY